MKITASITREIEESDIVDSIVTALEGGSNYWYELHVDTKELGNLDKAPSERIALAALSGYNIQVFDVEEGDYLGDLNKETIERGIKLYSENRGEFDPAMDADEADCLFQYIVMGEIVYG